MHFVRELPASLKREKLKMKEMEGQFRCHVWSAGGVLAALSMVFTLASAQNLSAQVKTGPVPIVGGFEKVRPLPPGGPAPRMADGHVDLTGRWYPNAGGKMLQGAYPLDPAAFLQFDPKTTPEEKPSFKPGMGEKYKSPATYGMCDQAGTPSTTLEQTIQHAPMEIIHTPKRLVILDEYPLNVRMIYTRARVHPKDPDPTFNGDSVVHWEKDTLVIDVVAIDERLGNIGTGAVGEGGSDGATWLHSNQERVIERFTRSSKNYLTYQVTIEDPVVLAKPWTSAPRTWSLAQAADDEWGEVFCTLNQEPEEIKKIQNEAKTKGK
jgi:hypothetical protein